MGSPGEISRPQQQGHMHEMHSDTTCYMTGHGETGRLLCLLCGTLTEQTVPRPGVTAVAPVCLRHIRLASCACASSRQA